jgi:hypothetical protein
MNGYCPSDVNMGFIELVGPIQHPDLNDITVNSYPLSISFAPRTTAPSLIGNRIDESAENTCTYKGQKFSLIDVQLCSVTNKGHSLPGTNEIPVAELILSFVGSKGSNLSGVLLSIPIYDSGTPSHNAYLLQLIDPEFPSCKYTNVVGADYGGDDYRNIQDSSLNNCIKTCCGDPECLAYTFTDKTCYLKNAVPTLKKTGRENIISGTVDHTTLLQPACKEQSCKKNKKENKIANLQTIFYEDEKDTTHTSLAYKTCFETVDSSKNPSSKTLYIVVFPNGIHITQQNYQQLLLQIGGTLKPYMCPPVIRNAEETVRLYKYDDEGRKVTTATSRDGQIYRTPLSSCTDEFKQRFEYFKLPPRLPSKFKEDVCPYYKTSQYKCVPFNQLKDLSGNYVIPGNKTLDTILYEKQKVEGDETKPIKASINTEQIEGIVAGIAGVFIASVLAIKVGSWISKNY